MVTTISGNVVTIKSPCDTPVQSLKVHFSPIQNGSGNPSPSNIREITGWTGLSVTQCGKNLFDEQYPDIGDSVIYRPIYIGGGTVTMSTTAPINTNGGANLFLVAGNVATGGGTTPNGVWKTRPVTATADNGYVTVAYRDRMSVNPREHNTMIEFGTTPSEYEPYSGTTTSVDWSTEAGTVYGGYVDLISGELVATYKLVTYTGDSSEYWEKSASINRFFTIANDVEILAFGTRHPVVSNIGMFRNSTNSIYTIFAYQVNAASNKLIYYYPPSDITNETSFKQWLSQNNMQVCYNLATPIIYHLNPSQLNILRGHNNIFSNANSECEVMYDHRDTLDILSARKTAMIAMDAANLYKGQDVTFTRFASIALPGLFLSPGTYRFSAVVTSSDTDDSVCMTRFMHTTEQDANGTVYKIERSVNGEPHSLIFECQYTTYFLYFYASSNYPKGTDDVATYKDIRIERIG